MNDQGGIIVMAVAGAVILLPLIWIIATFNRFVRLRQHIRESWADIDVELKRRYDLIPNLVETVKGYAQHEREVLERVIALRNLAAANHGTAASQATDESAMLLGLRQVFAVAERYPQLKADENFLMLQKELANTEDRIAAARRFFNGNVRELNALASSIPTSVVAKMMNVHPETFFELSSEAERVVPRVQIAPQTQPAT
jgi:LemA protein